MTTPDPNQAPPPQTPDEWMRSKVRPHNPTAPPAPAAEPVEPATVPVKVTESLMPPDPMRAILDADDRQTHQ